MIVSKHIATFQFDRPDRHNAIDTKTMNRFEHALDALDEHPEVTVFIIRGNENAFAAGGDLEEFSSYRDAASVGGMVERMTSIFSRLEALPCWTIAFVEGPAFGGGTETALACDFRIATANARFGFTQARFAVSPGWGGLTRMIDCVGASTAMLWLATCAKVSSDDAVRAGLVDKLVESSEAFDAFVDTLTRDRALINALKTGVASSRGTAYTDAIAAEKSRFVNLWLREEHHISIQQFLE